MKIFEAIKLNSLVMLKEALKEIDNINAIRSEEEESILSFAIKNRCDLALFEALVEAGADIFYTDEEGVGLIDDAIKKGRADIVKFLVEKGVDPNSTKRKSGFTPLMGAMAYGDEEITKYLLQECKVDPSIKDSFEKSAADYARMTGYKHLLKYLEE